MEKFEYNKLHPVHTIVQYTYTIQEEQESISFKLGLKPRLDFQDIFSTAETRIHAIITFLALLEMINSQIVRIIAGENINNFWIEAQPVIGNSEEE